MREQGVLIEWQDDKGFGFVDVKGKGNVFVHISAFLSPPRRPQNGDTIAFDVTQDEQKRPTATRVKLMYVKRAASSTNTKSNKVTLVSLIVPTFVAILAFATVGQPNLWPLALVYVLLSLLIYVLYAKDKQAAMIGEQRVAENTLHLLALLGGWPGALLAQRRHRHKSSKKPFLRIFWVTVILNWLACFLILSPQGQQYVVALSHRILSLM